MNAKEIIEILVQADIIAAEADIETTYTQKREWIAKEILAKSKEEAGINDDELDKLAEAYSKEILPHEKEGSLARTQLEVGFIDGYRAAFGKEEG